MAVSILGEAAVRLRPETSGFGVEAEAGIAGPLREVAGKAAGLFAAAFAAEKVGEFLKDSVAVASDVSESTSKVGVVFGEASASVLKFAQTSATSMGLSKGQALEAAGTFGNLFRAIGLTEQKSADMSVKLTGLAGDLASFNNTDPAQALEALRAGLIGSTEPLRQYGVNLNQAQIGAEAVRLGLAKSAAEMTPAAQAQAAYNLILQQTSLAQGDFGRTSGGLANQTRIINAQFTDLKGNVGGALVPFVQLGAHAISGVLMPALLGLSQPLLAFGDSAAAAFNDIQSYARAGASGVDASTVAIDNRWQALGFRWATTTTAMIGHWTTLTDAFRGGGVGMLQTEVSVDGFLARFGSGLRGLATQARGTWAEIVSSAGPAIAGLEGAMTPSLLTVKSAIGDALAPSERSLGQSSGRGIVGFLSAQVAAAGPLISSLIGKVTPVITAILPVLTGAFTAILPTLTSVFHQIIPVVSAVLPVILQITGIMGTLFRTAFMALLPVIPPLVQTIGQLVTTLVGGLGPVLVQLAPLISTLIQTGLNEFKAVLMAIVPILPPLISAIGQVAQMLAGALLAVVSALMPVLPVIAQALGQIAVAIGGALIAAVSAIAPILPTLINAFMSLIRAALGPLMLLLPAIVSLIPPLVGVIVALVQAVAPFLPLIVRVVVTLVQLAVVALQPLLPLIQIAASLLVVLVRAMVPIVTIALQVVAWLLRIAGALTGSVIGAVSAVIGWFQRLLGGISGVVATVGRLLGGMFSGLAGAAEAAFNGVTGAIRWAINGIIGIINGAIGFINGNLIGTINNIPGVSVPNIPSIPTLHSGGVFTSDNPAGEGLALLRDNELVVTPEQRTRADDMLRALLDGNLGGTTTTTSTVSGHTITIEEHIHSVPGESAAVIAARTTQGVVWNLNAGITRPVGAGATT